MPPLPIITGTLRVTLNYTDAVVGHAANVMHFLTVSDPEVFLDDFEANVPSSGSAMWAPMASSARLSGIDVLPLDGTTATISRTIGTNAKYNGQGGGAPVPAVAALVKLQTATRGRRYRGRIFIPFLGESAISDGKVNASSQGDCTLGWTTFANAMVADGHAIAVASYRGGFATQVINLACESVCATQRRRQDRLR